MISYLTFEDYAVYNQYLSPSQNRNAGGMQSKVYRVREALDLGFPGSKVVSEVEDINANVVLVEPLRFFMRPGDGTLEKLKALDAKKILYGSEFAPMRVPPSVRDALFEACDLITVNCKFLQNLFAYIGWKDTHLLVDPYPTDMFCLPTAERKNRVVAGGQISWQKNTMHLIEVFKRLEGVAERVYIGSGTLWGKFDWQKRLEDELFEHTDRIVPDATPAEVAVELKEAKCGVWCAFHDTFSSWTHEALCCGLPVVASCHGLSPELPIQTAMGVDDQVRLVGEILDMPSDAYQEQSEGLAQWSVENVSYEVFLSQLRDIVRLIV